MLISQTSLNPLRPAFAPELAVMRNVRLPVGGPTGTGGKYAKGTVLGCVGGAAANAVWTLTIGGSGTVTLTFTADKVYQASFAHNASLAAVKTALEVIFGAGNLTVTGTPGTEYVVTFGGALAAVKVGGNLAVSGATSSIARTTAGNAGAGQYEAYDNSAVGVARCVLMYDLTTDPQGGLVTEAGRAGQPFSPVAYVAGYFNAADLPNLDAAAVSDPGWRLVEGAAITDTGAVIGIGV